MTGLERVLAALDRNGVEAYPLDLCGSTVTGIADGALSRLLEARGLPPERTPIDSIQGISAPPPDILAALGSDTLRIGTDRIGPFSSAADGAQEAPDRFGVQWRRAPDELYFSQVSTPLEEGTLSEALGRLVLPEPDAAAIRASIEIGRRDAARLGLFPVLDRDCAGLLEMSARLRGTERLYMDFYDDPAGVEELAERLLDYKTRYWDAVLEAWGGAAVGAPIPAGIAEADDYGSELSLLLSPSILRGTYIARYARLLSRIKSRNPEARVIFHSCGAIRPIIPDLIEAGVEALNPVQYRAAGMDAADLKRDFGSRLCFWGGAVDTKRILPGGSPAEVRAELLRAAGSLGRGGGYVCATVHNIQDEVPTANILAYLDAVAELREGRRAA
jgi:uroporphyrinogen decarboxylase